jgi:hypothetical protein
VPFPSFNPRTSAVPETHSPTPLTPLPFLLPSTPPPSDNHGCKELGAPAGRIFDSLSLHLDSDLTAPAPNQPPAPPPPPAAPKKLIIDTDLGFDADDAVALCLAHALADGGEIELLGVTHDAGYPMGVAAVAAINTW